MALNQEKVDDITNHLVSELRSEQWRINFLLRELAELTKDFCEDCSVQHSCWKDSYQKLCLLNGRCLNRQVE